MRETTPGIMRGSRADAAQQREIPEMPRDPRDNAGNTRTIPAHPRDDAGEPRTIPAPSRDDAGKLLDHLAPTRDNAGKPREAAARSFFSLVYQFLRNSLIFSLKKRISNRINACATLVNPNVPAPGTPAPLQEDMPDGDANHGGD